MSDQDILGQSDKLQIASLTEENRLLKEGKSLAVYAKSDLLCRLHSVSALLALLVDGNEITIDTDNELLVAAKHLLELIENGLES